MIINARSETATKALGARLGGLLRGGEVVELIGDVGAGKTTLAKGIGEGLKIDEPIASPSFTISRLYSARDGLQLAHYDFYRLLDAGLMADELAEAIDQPDSITLIEWGEVVAGVLPRDRLTINIESPTVLGRRLSLSAGGPVSQALVDRL